MGNYWGKVRIDRKGRARAFKLNGVTRRVFEEYNIPKFVKTKMAMLDFMEKDLKLPCGSYWRMLVNEEYENPLEPLKTYFICED